MKQIIQSYKTGEMKLAEVPVPIVCPGAVVIKTMSSFVSAGTERMLVDLAKKSIIGKAHARPDLVKKVIAAAKKEGIANTLQKVRRKLDTPIPLGYSCVGFVEELGAEVDNFQIGDLVACGGAGYANHAEYNVVPHNLCVRVPKNIKSGNHEISFEESAAATVGAIALQGVRQANLTIGERVCVIGLGLIGLLTIQIAKACGCPVIGADLEQTRIDLAKHLGVDDAVQVDDLETTVEGFTQGIGADAVIVAATAKDSKLIALAGEISRLKGRVVVVGFVGMDIPRDIYYRKELDLRLSMSYGPGRYDVEYEEKGHDYPLAYVRWTEQRNMQSFLELVSGGKIDIRALITHRFPFEKALDAYRMILDGSEPYLGIVFEYSRDSRHQKIRMNEYLPAVAEKNITLGVIGAGNFAKAVLLPIFARISDTQLHSVTTARGVSAKSAAEMFGFKNCVRSKDDILTNDSVNTVLIATRHNLHGPLVIEALQAGKHVFVEKPLCISVNELRQIAEFLNSEGTESSGSVQPILMVGFNRRYSPFISKIKAVLENRHAPMMANYTINAGFIPRDSWIQDPAEGGGRIIGEVCHFVDTLKTITGSSVRTVQATCVQSDNKLHTNRDSLVATLTYEDGSVGTIIYHALGHPDYPKERLEVVANEMVIVNTDYNRLEIIGRKKEKMKAKQDKGFEAELNAFAASILSGGPPPIPLMDLIETTAVTFAIQRALETGKTIFLSEFSKDLEIVC
jgi:predicted dehydrogenase/threonine dehydrogenase-like Zn-dependent dehydrogenase